MKKYFIIVLTIVLNTLSINMPDAQAAAFRSFADIAEKAIPGVVNIRTTKYVRRQQGLDLYDFFLNGRVPIGRSTSSLGSGIIISKQGHIITNHHVIANASTIEILFAKKKEKVRAAVIGSDPKTDLALLKIKANKKLKPLDFGNSDLLRIGDAVLAIGNPFGFSHTVTSGIVSARGRVIGSGPYDNFLQTDASIHPGNSGGPLLDTRGRVIGVNTAVSSEGAGIGFAIPINLVKNIVHDLKRYGKVKRPWLGLIGKNILSRDDVGTGVDPSGVFGVIVSNLIVDGPAQRGGIRIGDLIMGIGKKKIYDLNGLQKLLTSQRPADKVVLKVYRRGKGFVYLNIALEEIPKNQDLPNEKDLF